MQTIFIATDFSAAAQNATRYGFELAKEMRGKVILFNCCNHVADVYISASQVMDETIRTIHNRLEESVVAFDALRTLEVKTQCVKGAVTNSILKVATEHNVSFIIVGLKENGKPIRKIFGSTITALISQSTVPVIVVPEGATVSFPGKIALAADLTFENDIDTVRPLKTMVENLNSRLSIVRVIDKYFDEPVEILMSCSKPDWFLKSLTPDYEFLQEDDAGKAILDYVENNSIDLLAVVFHKHNLLERMFKGSTATYFSFHTLVPLLVLPSKIANKTKIDKKAYDFCTGKCHNKNGVPQCNKYHKLKLEYEQEIKVNEKH